MKSSVKIRTHKTIATVWPDEKLFWKVQLFIAVGTLILSLTAQIGLALWDDPQLFSKGLPHINILLTVGSVLIVSVPAFIHGYFEVSEPWRITENRILRKRKQVCQLYEIEEVRPRKFGLKLVMHSGSSLHMMYISNSEEVGEIIARTAEKSVENLSL